eukprot:360649-Chlamydomonas_euryale.AAC.4
MWVDAPRVAPRGCVVEGRGEGDLPGTERGKRVGGVRRVGPNPPGSFSLPSSRSLFPGLTHTFRGGGPRRGISGSHSCSRRCRRNGSAGGLTLCYGKGEAAGGRRAHRLGMARASERAATPSWLLLAGRWRRNRRPTNERGPRALAAHSAREEHA